MMRIARTKPNTQNGGRSGLLSGILLGALLTLFTAVLIYAAYLFLQWGRTAAGAVPQLPPLSLPQLVRAAPFASGEQDSSGTSESNLTSGGQSSEQAAMLTDRVTILLMGVDSRPDETVSRTDSIMLVTLNPTTGSAGVLSLPRDLLVSVPGMTDTVKINTVHVLGEINRYPGGGPARLQDTISTFLGYPIDFYVRLNFEGFEQIIDLIGGVDIDVPKVIDDPKYPDNNYGYDPLYIPAGLQHMDGELALKYARTRHVDSDYGRADRQQQVLLAVKEKVTRPGQLAALLPRLPSLALAMANTVQTDMPIDKAIELARTVGQIDLQNPTTVVVDSSMGVESTDPVKGFILTPDTNKIRAAAAAVFSDAEPFAAEQASEAETLRGVLISEAARLVVLNGTGEGDLASRHANALSGEGYAVVAIGNAEKADYSESWLIIHGEGKPSTIDALQRRYAISPDRTLSEPPDDAADLTLILGADQAAVVATP